ncbi:hypothetical protein EYF80_020078 [Liparis tanakae]|uniref:Uncharacterized protein n=1 Tax=Liparis tanakae TaxID=230148 RepID=A0A4Z2HXF7_9TELE|nr:hypothetical protein EYF80_020078 [Liparis tanakae]
MEPRNKGKGSRNDLGAAGVLSLLNADIPFLKHLHASSVFDELAHQLAFPEVLSIEESQQPICGDLLKPAATLEPQQAVRREVWEKGSRLREDDKWSS